MPDEGHLQYVPEPPAVSMTFIGWTAFSALLLLGIAIGGFHAIYQISVPTKTVPAPATFPQPRVDTGQIAELHRIESAQRSKLESWGWTNDQHTLATIPIERAMQLLAGKGSDAYAPLLAPQPALSAPTAAAERAVTPDAAAQGGQPAAPPPGGTKP
ncbi:hypothetical protein [Bradyrhizobium sp.]|uniref:hypothetical protein n=1 Tax=Bradyrhizobium sp. TaxID=376 RepID=UPI003C6B5D82